MREIEFRGKRLNNRGWTRGFLTMNYQVIPETVGQYTGLKDKNGVKIFEGDIVEYSPERPSLPPYRGVVVYKEDNAAFFIKRDDGDGDRILHFLDDDRIEVLGTIHDNPELLAGNKPDDEYDEEEEDNAAE